MDPVTAMILASAVTAGIGFYQSQQQQDAMRSAQRQQQRQQIANENALVKQAYGKRQQALGLGLDAPKSPMGNQASQTGAVLTSTSGLGQNNLLG